MTLLLAMAGIFLAGCVLLPKWVDRLVNAASVTVCVAAAVWTMPAKADATAERTPVEQSRRQDEVAAAFYGGRLAELYIQARRKEDADQ